MDPIIGGAIISGLGSLFGGIAGSSSNAAINKKNLEWAKEQQIRNENLQREFAQTGIQWKIKDAQAAGIHPLAALGANTISYSPQVIGTNQSPDTHMPTAMANIGQDIGRAVSASETDHQRKLQQLQIASMEQDVIGKQLQNSILHKQSFVGPPMPTASDNNVIQGQGNAPANKYIVKVPQQRTISPPGQEHKEPGDVPDVGYARTKTGWVPVPSDNVKQRIEDNLIQETLWAVRNNLVPYFTGGDPPSQAPDTKWHWSGEYRQPEWVKYPDDVIPRPYRKTRSPIRMRYFQR